MTMAITQIRDKTARMHASLPLDKIDMSEQNLSLESRKLQEYIRQLACTQLSDRMSLKVLETYTRVAELRRARQKALERLHDALTFRVLEICSASVNAKVSKGDTLEREIDMQSLETLEYYTVLAEAKKVQQDALRFNPDFAGSEIPNSLVSLVESKTANDGHSRPPAILPLEGRTALRENNTQARSFGKFVIEGGSDINVDIRIPVRPNHHKELGCFSRLSDSLEESSFVPRTQQEVREQSISYQETSVDGKGNVKRDSNTWINVVVEDHVREEDEEMSATTEEQWELVETIEGTADEAPASDENGLH